MYCIVLYRIVLYRIVLYCIDSAILFYLFLWRKLIPINSLIKSHCARLAQLVRYLTVMSSLHAPKSPISCIAAARDALKMLSVRSREQQVDEKPNGEHLETSYHIIYWFCLFRRPWDKDRFMSPDIDATTQLLRDGKVTLSITFVKSLSLNILSNTIYLSFHCYIIP